MGRDARASAVVVDWAGGSGGRVAGAELQPEEWAAAIAGDGAEEFTGGVCVLDGRSLREGASDDCSDRCGAAKSAPGGRSRCGRAAGDCRGGTAVHCEGTEGAAGRRLDDGGNASREGERRGEGEPDVSRGARDLAGFVGGCREDSRGGAQWAQAGGKCGESDV